MSELADREYERAQELSRTGVAPQRQLDETRSQLRAARADVAGVPAVLSRTGYTGEDGFELFCAWQDAPALWAALTDAGVEPSVVDYINTQMKRTIDWDDAAAMIEEWGGPFAVKGVMSVADARRAVDAHALEPGLLEDFAPNSRFQRFARLHEAGEQGVHALGPVRRTAHENVFVMRDQHDHHGVGAGKVARVAVRADTHPAGIRDL